MALVTRDGLRLIFGGLVLKPSAARRSHGVHALRRSPLDAATWAAAAALMIAAGVLATLVPAMRATRVDPLIAIRAE
jgi:hypothetical protein